MAKTGTYFVRMPTSLQTVATPDIIKRKVIPFLLPQPEEHRGYSVILCIARQEIPGAYTQSFCVTPLR
jgi:hypothetical protein